MDPNNLEGLGWWFRLPYQADLARHPRNFENFLFGALDKGLSRIQSEEEFQTALQQFLQADQLRTNLELLKELQKKKLEKDLAQQEDAQRREALLQGLKSFLPEVGERLKDLPTPELSKIAEKLGENFATNLFNSQRTTTFPDFDVLPEDTKKLFGSKEFYDTLTKENPETTAKLIVKGGDLGVLRERTAQEIKTEEGKQAIKHYGEKEKELSQKLENLRETMGGIAKDPALPQISTEISKHLQDKNPREYIDTRDLNVQKHFLENQQFLDKPEYDKILSGKLQMGGTGLSERFLEGLRDGRYNLLTLRELRQKIDAVGDPEKRKILDLEFAETLASVAEVMNERYGSKTDNVFQLLRAYWIAPLSSEAQTDQGLSRLIAKLEAGNVIEILKNFTGQKSNYELQYAEKAGTTKREGLTKMVLFLKAIAEPDDFLRATETLIDKNRRERDETIQKILNRK